MRCILTCHVEAAIEAAAFGDGTPALNPARGETCEEGARGAISDELSARQCHPQGAGMSAALPKRGGGMGKRKKLHELERATEDDGGGRCHPTRPANTLSQTTGPMIPYRQGRG